MTHFWITSLLQWQVERNDEINKKVTNDDIMNDEPHYKWQITIFQSLQLATILYLEQLISYFADSFYLWITNYKIKGTTA